MTNPFLLQFREAITSEVEDVATRRYDCDRSISQVFEGGQWVDLVESRKDEPVRTKVTKVNRETTDDD